jgi:ATP-binding cassette subfamily F protein 3
MALNEFEGTVMLVSHDRALLRAVCDEFWLVSRGGIAPFDGDLDDYQRYLLDVAKQSREAQKQEQRDQAKAPAPVAKAAVEAPPANRSPEQRKQDAQRRQALTEQLRPLKKELERNEKETARLNAQRSALETRLASPMVPNDMAEAGRELKQVNDSIEALELRWLELTEQVEQAAQT